MQETDWPAAFALAKAGNSMAAKITIMAMTTSSSMSVKATACGDCGLRIADWELEEGFICFSLSSIWVCRETGTRR